MPAGMKLVGIPLLGAFALWIAWPPAAVHAKPPLRQAIKRQLNRNAYVHFETLVDALGVTPGMTILDIGAGPGYASFLFAEKLRGTGAVYAAEVREDFVGHIADEAKRRGLGNLHAVAVKPDGLDDFYGKHRYDLVLLSNVYHCLDDRVAYFTALRRFLRPGARLALVLYNQAPLFSVDDIADVDGLADALSEDVEGEPFYRHLSPRTRQLVDTGGRDDGLASALVDDFNRMLTDPRFYENFYGASYFPKDLFTAPERDFANWLLMTLQEDGVLERPAARPGARDMRAVIRLNRLFFAAQLGDYLAGDGTGAYLPAGDANRHTSKFVALRELDAAGYRFIEEMTLSPYFDAVIVAPKEP